jgi:hypothetical protein
MTALLRSSELVENKYKSAANRAPIMLSDLRFVRKTTSGEQVDVEVLSDGTLSQRLQAASTALNEGCPRPSQTRFSESGTNSSSRASSKAKASMEQWRTL